MLYEVITRSCLSISRARNADAAWGIAGPVTPVVQAPTGQVQAHHRLVPGQSYVEADIRVAQVHCRAPAPVLHEPVDHRVLAALRPEAGVADCTVLAAEIDRQALRRTEMRAPVSYNFV